MKYIFLVFILITNFAEAATPLWVIDCRNAGARDTILKIELYRTGHPMGGLYSIGGLVSHRNYVFMTDFISIKPLLLKGMARDLDETQYLIELSPGLIDSTAVLPAKVEMTVTLPPGGTHKQTLALVCEGHK